MRSPLNKGLIGLTGKSTRDVGTRIMRRSLRSALPTRSSDLPKDGMND